ncbi:MAG: hypothetical protein ABR573_08360 [Candidatus Dormibacteria bacterium]
MAGAAGGGASTIPKKMMSISQGKLIAALGAVVVLVLVAIAFLIGRGSGTVPTTAHVIPSPTVVVSQ